MKKLNVFIIIFVVVATAGIFGYYMYQEPGETPSPTPTSTNDFDQSPSPSPTSNNNNSDNWEVYRKEDAEISFSYPSEAELSANENIIIKLTYMGPTQSPGTEVSDGYIISFIETGEIDEDLMTIAGDKQTEEEQSPVTREVTEINEVAIAGVSGYKFNSVSLGESVHYILSPNDTQMYFYATVIISDPGRLGFASDVERILSSVEFVAN